MFYSGIHTLSTGMKLSEFHSERITSVRFDHKDAVGHTKKIKDCIYSYHKCAIQQQY